MTIDFQKLVEFNNKHPDKIDTFEFIVVNMISSEDTNEDMFKGFLLIDELYQVLERKGLIKIVGEGYKDVSIRDLGLELIGQSKSDTVIELAEKIRELFPRGVRSGGKLVKSSTADIADKLRKFFKKHKYSQEQVLNATERYIQYYRQKDWAFMQAAIYFIEKDGVSALASEIDNLKDGKDIPIKIELTEML